MTTTTTKTDTDATDVECPTCHAWVGWACKGADYGAHCAGYHPARIRAAERAAAVETNQSTPDPQDWSKPSLGVIAYDGKSGIVLWAVGVHIEAMIKHIGGHEIEELGFESDPPAAGIWIWEGKMYAGDYDDAYLKGEYRPPTDEEWLAIRVHRCPWNPDEWLRTDRNVLDSGE